LLALSFPKFGHPACGWIALAPLLVALIDRSAARPETNNPLAGRKNSLVHAFALGATTGAVYFSGTLYWITHVMVAYGGLDSWVAVLVNGLLIAYMALFPALFAVAMHRIILVFGARGLLVAPFVWVATELGRTYTPPGGFPWSLLGYSQVTVLPVAQLASVLGVYGVSALVATVSATAVFAVATKSKRERVAALASVASIVLLVATWGSLRVAGGTLTDAGEPLKVGVAQGNVEQGEKWVAGRAASIFQEYLRMTRQAIGGGADLVLWPESATPFFFDEDRPAADVVRTLVRQARVSMLLGSDQREAGASRQYYNAAFLVQADGTTGGVYRKIHLVPFGEYVPMKRALFFAAPLVQAVSDFSPGERAVLLPLGEHRISTAICYEVVYPALMRQFVRGGSELLTTITNDAWFGRTSAPYQHFAQAAMRAIEQGRYLVRSANTGISGIVDPYGRVLVQTEIFRPDVFVGSVRLLKTSTFYGRTGDVFAYASVLVTVVMLVLPKPRSVQ
jgi:apolipoprotein N-acyltransferase